MVLDPFVVFFLLQAEVLFTTCKFNEFHCKLLDLVLTGWDKFFNRPIFLPVQPVYTEPEPNQITVCTPCRCGLFDS